MSNVDELRSVLQNGIMISFDLNDSYSDFSNMINLSTDERREMGLKGREKIEQHFDEKVIVGKIVNRIESVLNVA